MLCSIRSYDFERIGRGFKQHTTEDHNMWSYLFFMMHLREKRPLQWNALERYFHDRLKKGEEQKCFPVNKSLATEAAQEAEVHFCVLI